MVDQARFSIVERTCVWRAIDEELNVQLSVIQLRSMRISMEVMNMNRKAKRLKRELGGHKSGAIANIAMAVMLWVSTAVIWPMLEDIRAGLLLHLPDAPLSWFFTSGPMIVFILFGAFALATGIGMLHLNSRVDDVLRDIVPDEYDE